VEGQIRLQVLLQEDGPCCWEVGQNRIQVEDLHLEEVEQNRIQELEAETDSEEEVD
jgi:hypothetical protein